MRFGRSCFYRCRAAYARRSGAEICQTALNLRSKYNLGLISTVVSGANTTASKISDAGIACISRRNGVGRLPRGTRMRSVHTKRYNKQLPDCHIQTDVKFLTFIGKRGEEFRQFQYSAIDEAIRVRALNICDDKQTHADAIAFVDPIIAKSAFRLKDMGTDNGHECQAKSQWYVENQGARHAPSSRQRRS